MRSAMVGLFLLAMFIAFVGVIALLVVGFERAIGDRLRAAWDEIDRRSADDRSAAGGDPRWCGGRHVDRSRIGALG